MENNMHREQTTSLFMRPVEIRQLTDKFFILLLPVSLLLWLKAAIFEIFKETIHINIGNRFLWLCQNFFCLAVILVLLTIVLLVIFKRLKENLLVYLIIIVTIIPLALRAWMLYAESNARLIIYLRLDLIASILDETPDVLSILSIILLLIYNVTILMCIKKLGNASLGPMIKEPFRAIAKSFRVSIFALVIIFLLVIVFIISKIFLFMHVNDLYGQERWKKILTRLWFWTSFFAGTYIFNFIWNLGFTAIGDYFVNYYDGQNVSLTDVYQNMIEKTLRYHIGTVAFTSIPILPSVCALIMAFKSNKLPRKQSDGKLINFISKISLIINISEYALIQTSVYGFKTLKSIRQMVDLHYSNPLLFLTLNAVPHKIVDFSVILIIIIQIYLFQLYGVSHWDVFFLYSISSLLVRPATSTFTIYKMIRDQHESEISDEQTELTEH